MIGTIKKGTDVIVTSGEYDDYSVWGTYRAKTEIDIDMYLAEYLEIHPDEKEEYRFNEGQFFTYLLDHKIFEAQQIVSELHLTNYGHVDTMAYYENVIQSEVLSV